MARKLFFDIVQVVGFDEAKQIFESTVDDARKLVPAQTKPIGANDSADELRLWLAWELWSREHPGRGQRGPNKTAFGKWFWENLLSPQDQDRYTDHASIVRQLDRIIGRRNSLN